MANPFPCRVCKKVKDWACQIQRVFSATRHVMRSDHARQLLCTAQLKASHFWAMIQSQHPLSVRPKPCNLLASTIAIRLSRFVVRSKERCFQLEPSSHSPSLRITIHGATFLLFVSQRRCHSPLVAHTQRSGWILNTPGNMMAHMSEQ